MTAKVFDLSNYSKDNLVPPEHQREALTIQSTHTMASNAMLKVARLEEKLGLVRYENAELRTEIKLLRDALNKKMVGTSKPVTNVELLKRLKAKKKKHKGKSKKGKR